MEVLEIKKLIQAITTSVSEETNIKYKVNPITIREFYNDQETYPFSLNTKKKYVQNCGGFNEKNGLITILIDENELSHPTYELMMKYAQITFHELRHTMQNYEDKDSYKTFFIKLDKIIQRHNYIEYQLEHDNFSYEIDANLYGITKAEKYIEKHYPDIYKTYKLSSYKKIMDKKKDDATHKSLIYDHISRVDKIINAIKTNYVAYPAIYPHLPHPMQIFLEKDGSYKKISNILNNPNFYKLDKKITYTILSTRFFLETINYEELSIPERKILLKALRYSVQKTHQTQEEIKSYQKKYGSISTQISKEQNPIRRFQLNIEHIAIIINKLLNPVTDYRGNKIHKRKLQTIITKIEEGDNRD